MIATLRAEFKKLLTARSTYIWTGLTVLLIGFMSFYAFGYSVSEPEILEPNYMMTMFSTVLATFVTIATILSILLVAHEYRYNTIMYTLTASPSRVRVLLVKIIVMITYATVVGAALLGISYIATKLGLSIKGVSMMAQDVPVWDTLWRFVSYTWGYVLVGIIIATIVRGLVGSIVLFFLFPTVEQLSTLVIKDNAKFLPFRSLDSIISFNIDTGMAELTSKAALGVFAIYLVIGLIVAAVLFVKRDAN